jgi:hypothetical protein
METVRRIVVERLRRDATWRQSDPSRFCEPKISSFFGASSLCVSEPTKLTSSKARPVRGQSPGNQGLGLI